MRLLVQCLETGRFLVPSGDGGVTFVYSLKQAGGGVVGDVESALQLVADHSEFTERLDVIDLDRLGTANDYKD